MKSYSNPSNEAVPQLARAPGVRVQTSRRGDPAERAPHVRGVQGGTDLQGAAARRSHVARGFDPAEPPSRRSGRPGGTLELTAMPVGTAAVPQHWIELDNASADARL